MDFLTLRDVKRAAVRMAVLPENKTHGRERGRSEVVSPDGLSKIVCEFYDLERFSFTCYYQTAEQSGWTGARSFSVDPDFVAGFLRALNIPHPNAQTDY